MQKSDKNYFKYQYLKAQTLKIEVMIFLQMLLSPKIKLHPYYLL